MRGFTHPSLRGRWILLTTALLAPISNAGEVVNGGDPVSQRINAWFAEGTAAGLDGFYYDNRDRGHSGLRVATYPQLVQISYTEDERAQNADWGSQRKLLPGKVVIGNSSTASPATQAGSHQRMLYLHPQGLPFLSEQFRSNALYIYPEHRDHDPGTNGPEGFGDLYPANSPYLITSQGSSGSDLAFLHAFLKTSAAFPPETQDALVAKGLLMPTLQAIFRQTYKAAPSAEGYFTGNAHPSAFDGALIDEAAMVELAHAMPPGAIPPIVRLRVIEEPEAVAGRDYFEPDGLAPTGERLADTPSAIARIIRAPELNRRIRVSASHSIDPRDRPLTFRWAILRGDPERITIETRRPNREEATITVAYHERRPIAPGSDLESNRVDIGVFAMAEGSIVSAPAFVTFTTLPNEHRSYAEDGRIMEIFYGARSDSLGVPPAESPRWDRLLERYDVPDTSVFDPATIAALTELARRTREQRTRLKEAESTRDRLVAAQREMVAATERRYAAAKAANGERGSETSGAVLADAETNHLDAKIALRDGSDETRELHRVIAALRAEVTQALVSGNAVFLVTNALESLRRDPGLSSRPGMAGAKLTEGRARLEEIGVTSADRQSPNGAYHWGQFNLELLSDQVFPDFLQRPGGLNYADPRLTSEKHWRDVFRHAADGTLTGWTRWKDGSRVEFAADGAPQLR